MNIVHLLVIWTVTIGILSATEWDSLVDQNYPETCSRNNLFGDSRNGQSSGKYVFFPSSKDVEVTC